MYFTLKESPAGSMKVSGAGMRNFVRRLLVRELAGDITCDSFIIENGGGIAALSGKNSKAENSIKSSFKDMGLPVRFVYFSEGAPDVAFAEKIKNSFFSPWLWCTLLSFIALIVFIGVRGIFWISFWGSVGWFTARAVPLILVWLFPLRRTGIETEKTE